jgi:hypothetical protein
MYALGVGSGLGAIGVVSQKDIDEVFKKRQAAMDEVRKLEAKTWIDQGKITEAQEKKRIDLVLTGIDAAKEGKEIAALTVEIKRQELIKQEAIANTYGLIAEASERNLVSLRLRVRCDGDRVSVPQKDGRGFGCRSNQK